MKLEENTVLDMIREERKRRETQDFRVTCLAAGGLALLMLVLFTGLALVVDFFWRGL